MTAGRRPRRRRPRGRNDVRGAIAHGRKQARQVLALRADRRQRRNRALRTGSRRAAAKPVPAPPARVLRDLGPAGSVGVLIAEGDSWFDYPMHDVLEMLEDD